MNAYYVLVVQHRPSYWWNSDKGYLGPAVLMQAYRRLRFKRYTNERTIRICK